MGVAMGLACISLAFLPESALPGAHLLCDGKVGTGVSAGSASLPVIVCSQPAAAGAAPEHITGAAIGASLGLYVAGLWLVVIPLAWFLGPRVPWRRSRSVDYGEHL